MKEEKVDREGEKERVCNARAFKVYPSQIFSLLSSLSLSLSFFLAAISYEKSSPRGQGQNPRKRTE